tara:strand:- start:125 stop:1234 length:1110 start_codon:yes stop_codon:yes gene_type:complete
MLILRFLISLAKVLLITFVFILIIDFFFGKKILEKFDNFFSKSQFYERLIRIDHPIYHHTLRDNVKYSNNVSFTGTYELCTNNHGFKSECNQQDDKNYEFAFLGDSFTEGTPIEYKETFVGLFADQTNFKTANLGVVSYSPKIYLSKINHLLDQGYKFNHIIVFIDISDFYDDTNFYSIDKNLVVSEKYSKEKNLKRRKFLRNNFPLTNFYMFVIKKYKIKKNISEMNTENEFPSFTDKVNLKAKWTYSKTNIIDGYDIGIDEGHDIMVNHMIDLHKILSKKNIKMSLAVYPWPHQLSYDVVNSVHVNIWQNFCENRCENFINYFPFFFNEVKKTSFLKTYKKYYFNNDPHFNKEGHKALADKLIEIFK